MCGGAPEYVAAYIGDGNGIEITHLHLLVQLHSLFEEVTILVLTLVYLPSIELVLLIVGSE